MQPASSVETRWRAALAAGLALLAGGCKVLPIDQARALKARDSGAFDVSHYVAEIWPARATQELRARAVPIETLRTEPPEALGQRMGHRAGDGSPWTFVVSGEGVVRAVDRESPRGRIEVDTRGGVVLIQAGPVVSGTAVRDAMPSITFDAFPDQISFAEAGMKLTDRALAGLRPTLAALKPGDAVRFLGAASITDADAPMVLTPIELAALPASAPGAAR